MTDEVLKAALLEKGKEANEKVRTFFTHFSFEQLNWKPSPESWSIGQCLDHLIVADRCYFPTFEKIISGTYQESIWQKYSPLSGLFGWTLKDQMKEQVKRGMKTSPIFYPTTSAIDLDVVDRYLSNLDTFLNYISTFRKLRGTIITSPVSPFITYSLRDCLIFLITHEHRHINQAIRVKEMDGFPR